MGQYPQTLAVARWCAAQGWPVHPLAARRKTPPANCPPCRKTPHPAEGCPCLPAGRYCHGFHAATLEQDLISAWWRVNPDFGVGVSCGPAGLVVIDVDSHPVPVPTRDRLLPGIVVPPDVDLSGLESGFHSLSLLAALRGAVDPAADGSTLRVRTPSGGLHIWYLAAPHLEFTCSAGSSRTVALAWQVDVRAHGGYIVAPGTRTNTGPYQALAGPRVPAPLPTWLSEELVRTGHLKEPLPDASARTVPPRALQAVIAAGGNRFSSGRRVLDRVLQEVADCAAVPAGAAFTEKLNRAAYTAGGLAAAGYLPAAEAEELLRRAAVSARPAQAHTSARIITSGLAAGGRQPLYVEKGRR
ncbi:bifunctional DNA primase/polymerase (plasmid) [Kitasatospora sp. NBC_00070]|uniref:bifunctional DNA primase/polymerase n=1 Tax=Kitasatospora sp. NBC_00070 TaxID=2975962 RepID=UPI002F91BF01